MSAKTTKKVAEETKTERKEFKLKQAFALWKAKSKSGATYFNGKDENFKPLKAFYNLKKQNPKEPDIKVYKVETSGELSENPYVSLWCNASKNGKKYLTGKIDGKRVVGFINSKATEKQPYVSVYWSEDEVKAEAKPEPKTEETKEPEFEEIPSGEGLPF